MMEVEVSPSSPPNVSPMEVPATFTCGDCGKQFDVLKYYTRHRLAYHSTEKPYICDICQNPFALKTQLKKHASVHKKPHQCTTCGHRFVTDTQLASHLARVHLASKPFSCDYCDWTFISAKTQAKHMKVKHGPPVEEVAEGRESDVEVES